MVGPWHACAAVVWRFDHRSRRRTGLVGELYLNSLYNAIELAKLLAPTNQGSGFNCRPGKMGA
jgi:hypothetical protein